MKETNTNTETLIKNTTKRLLFSEGKVHAKFEDIAREAGINRTLLHYYFRKREKLFEQVLQDAMNESFFKMFEILSSPKEFEKKIEEAVHHIVDCLAKYPFIESFIITEFNRDKESQFSSSTISAGKTFTKHFKEEVRLYLLKNKITGLEPEDFIVNMMALCAYPSSTKPLIQTFFSYSDKRYTQFLLKRKEILTKLVLMKF